MRSKLRHAVFALTAALLTVGTAVTTSGAAAASPKRNPNAETSADSLAYGSPARLGDGTARTYVLSGDDGPEEIGVIIDAAAANSMPTSPPTDGRHCYDANNDGRIDPLTECVGGYYLPLRMPEDAPEPYRWVLLNWNPFGHPPAMYEAPHLDVHFYVVPPSAVAKIRYGTCASLVACDQVAQVAKPLPAQYVPTGYPAAMPHTVEVAMGDHLDNGAGFVNGATFIYGSLFGSLAFLEPMVRQDALHDAPAGGPLRCTPVAQPAAWEHGGWYPTSYCLGQTGSGAYQVSLDGLVRRHPA